MINFLVWLLAAYGCSSILVQLVSLMMTCAFVRVGDPHVHYQLLLYNSEHSLEAVMRKLLFHSTIYGKSIKVSFVDHGSTDDTLHITSIYGRKHFYLLQDTELDTEQMITIDLRRS